MRRKRIFYFKKKKQNIEIDYDHLVPTQVVPGYTIDMPDMHWSVVSDNKVAIAMFTVFAVMQEKNKKIKFISITMDNEYACEIKMKANQKDYLEFCSTFLTLLKDDIEEIEINVG